MREYRCTCNAPYQHPCAGQLDIRERQGYYIWADCEEAAWEQMAQKFPDETKAGFTTQEWEGFNVRIVEHRKDWVLKIIRKNSSKQLSIEGIE